MSDKTDYVVRWEGEVVGTRTSKRDYPFAVVTTGLTEKGFELELTRLKQSIKTTRNWIEEIESGEDTSYPDPDSKIAEWRERIEESRKKVASMEDGSFEFEPGVLGYSSRRELAAKKKKEFADTYVSVIVETETK